EKEKEEEKEEEEEVFLKKEEKEVEKRNIFFCVEIIELEELSKKLRSSNSEDEIKQNKNQEVFNMLIKARKYINRNKFSKNVLNFKEENGRQNFLRKSPKPENLRNDQSRF